MATLLGPHAWSRDGSSPLGLSWASFFSSPFLCAPDSGSGSRVPSSRIDEKLTENPGNLPTTCHCSGPGVSSQSACPPPSPFRVLFIIFYLIISGYLVILREEEQGKSQSMVSCSGAEIPESNIILTS